MKNKIIILLLLTLLLTGCGIFNLDGFIMPDDMEFMVVVESLDTPEKICDYMKENFTYELHAFYAPDPYTLWKTKKADCNDYATFGQFVANWHGYETWQIQMQFEGDGIFSHCIAVYKEKELSYTDLDYYEYEFDSFKEIVERVCSYRNRDCRKYKVYDYKMNLIEVGN